MSKKENIFIKLALKHEVIFLKTKHISLKYVSISI